MRPRLPRLLTTVLAGVLVLPALAIPASADVVVQRTFGPDRVSTALEVSRTFRHQASDALLTTAISYPDALAAGALAHRLDGPLLLTPPDHLPTEVADELARLGVRTVWILGGTGAVSADVATQLAGMGFTVRRLDGATRYETAREIAEAVGTSLTGEVVLALGEHQDPGRAWPDAVASGTLAATPDRVPTVLTQPDSLPPETEQALATLQAREVIILGGTAVISEAVEQRLRALGYTTRRVSEGSRYDTSAALAREALERFQDDTHPAVFASGRAFPDALSAGSLAASVGGPLVLVPPNSRLPEALEQLLRDHADRLTEGIVVGGPAAADEYVVAQLNAALQGEPAPAEPPAPAEAPAPATPHQADAPSEPQPAEEDAAADDDGQPAESHETFTGNASWYGPGLEGNQTANGEAFDPDGMTAAHRTLPFDTIVRVTNQNNGRQVEVRINDRGPYSHDRVLDVSSGAADALQMKDDGVIPVQVEVLSYGEQ